MTIDEIYNYISFDAQLTIIINNQKVFSEDIAVVEFYWFLSKWYNEYGIKKKESFKYNTVEYEETVLAFSNDYDNRWKISSPWIKSGMPCFVSEDELDYQIQDVINSIASEIEMLS